jgi:hypothetical protein
MKKSIVLAVLVIISALSLPCKAQIRFGIKAGLNTGSNIADAASDPSVLSNEANYNGFLIGPTAEFPIPLTGAAIDLSALYSQKGIAFKDFGKASVSYLDIPVNFKYKFGSPKILALYLAAGPYVSYAFSGKFSNAEFSNIDYKKLDVGANAGFGVQLLNNIQVGANYSFGLAKNVAQVSTDGVNFNNVDYKNGLWSITLTYFLK